MSVHPVYITRQAHIHIAWLSVCSICTHYTWKITLEAEQNSPPRQGKNKYTNKSSTYFADCKNHSQKKHERESLAVEIKLCDQFLSAEGRTSSSF
jgi:hypothetical protein